MLRRPPGEGPKRWWRSANLKAWPERNELQVLQKRWDPTFSEHSHGFRPGRSARQAVREAQQYIAEGHGWVVDLEEG